MIFGPFSNTNFSQYFCGRIEGGDRENNISDREEVMLEIRVLDFVEKNINGSGGH